MMILFQENGLLMKGYIFKDSLISPNPMDKVVGSIKMELRLK